MNRCYPAKGTMSTKNSGLTFCTKVTVLVCKRLISEIEIK